MLLLAAPCSAGISSHGSLALADDALLQDVVDHYLAKNTVGAHDGWTPDADRRIAAVRVGQAGESETETGGRHGSLPKGTELAAIADPLEPVNRAFFHFNDKLYFWVLKPVATGYSWVMPEKLRICVRNFFSNIYMPVRAVNCLLQGKFKGFGTEVARFVLNSTMGVCGFGDPAKVACGIEMRDEDFGQTLGFYGLGPGFFLVWPVLGPSSLRDTFGYAGDAAMNPLLYLGVPIEVSASVRAYQMINSTSLVIGEYESFKRSALDPYVSLREAFHENRHFKIKR
jgi:phospholipid-binding lipoprotein MlaA